MNGMQASKLMDKSTLIRAASMAGRGSKIVLGLNLILEEAAVSKLNQIHHAWHSASPEDSAVLFTEWREAAAAALISNSGSQLRTAARQAAGAGEAVAAINLLKTSLLVESLPKAVKEQITQAFNDAGVKGYDMVERSRAEVAWIILNEHGCAKPAASCPLEDWLQARGLPVVPCS